MRAVDGSYMYNLRINVPTNMLNQAYTTSSHQMQPVIQR